MTRTYGQYCPVAAGLDLIGDRWMLLVCRELVIGDQRFTDLRTALPGLAPNLLTDRLRSLVGAGFAELVELPPPAARTVYHLTDRGRDVIPVLRALARMGVSLLDSDPPAGVDPRRVAHAFLAPWWRPGARLHSRLVVDGQAVDLVGERELRIVPPIGEPDLLVTTEVGALVRARRERVALEAAVDGPPDKLGLFTETFGLPLA